MRNAIVALAILGLLVGSSGAGAEAPESRPKFSVKWLRLGEKKIKVEIADTNSKRAYGLMFKEKLGSDEGMLFVFDTEEPVAFWMKNTLIPLAIGYFGRDQKLVDVQEMVPAVAGELHPRSYPSKHPAKYALEMPKGWYARNKILLGAKFTFADSENSKR